MSGFNPYRVFEYVATVLAKCGYSSKYIGFNPYRVFEYVATLDKGDV